MAKGMTKLANLINPEVMADMISATLPKAIKFSPIAEIDTTLVGSEGDTITVPKFAYIGDAEDVTEGVAMGTTVLTASSTTVTIKETGKAVEITDTALLSAHGDPVGESNKQLTMSMASKVDNDCVDALYTATLKFDGSASKISYDGIVDAVDVFDDENDQNTAKVMFIAPTQATTIRKDENFRDKNKYPLDVVMNGVIGEIGGCQIVKSKKVKKDESGNWLNPIVVVDVQDPNTDVEADDFATTQKAITIYMKRDVMVESDRDILKRTNVISANEHYGVALTNESKVVIATFKA